VILEAAPDERTLRNWKSLRYKKLEGDRKGQRSIRINDQWRIVFTLDESVQPPTIAILAIEDYH
jgi:proteic killer suppression protein